MIEKDDIAAVVAELGQPAYRTRQIYEALTRRLVTDLGEVTSLPVALRRELAARLSPLSLHEVTSQDGPGARKTLFATADGHQVEAVLMRSSERATVCVSTQVGCAVGCSFCASGRLGLRRSLSAAEMADQVFHFARELRAADRRVTNVVFMGMGEPFHNYDATLRACRLLNDADGFGLAARSISVSTVGVVPGIDRFAAEPPQFNLAVSLHAATDELRDRLVPLNQTYPLDELLAATRRFVVRTGRKLMFEYVVLAGVNDNAEQAAALVKRLRRPLYHLNLIAYNATGGEFARPEAGRLAAFQARLESGGLSVTLRHSPGGAIEAACGQLALRRDAGRDCG
jgi:23S rRNA (adenine2503-C2)-methyltransferase